MGLIKNTRFVCIDCEMTGLDVAKDKIIEVAACSFTFSENLETFESLIDPQCPIPAESLAIHHISSEMLVGKPQIDQVLPRLLEVIGSDIIIGHGVAMDIQMIAAAAKLGGQECHIQKNVVIDTLRLARHYGDSPSNALDNLARHFNVPIDDTHRAMKDVELNIAVFKHLVSRYQTTEQIFDLLSRPIKMKYMPLGKYKGRSFSEIPLDYLLHAAHLKFDQDLTFSIRLELKNRKKGGQFTQATNPFGGL